MRSRTASSNARSWISTLASIVLLIGAQALASTSPPHEYHVLSPEPLNGAVLVMSPVAARSSRHRALSRAAERIYDLAAKPAVARGCE